MVGGAYASTSMAQVDPGRSPGYCSTQERPGTWRSSPRDQYWSLKVNTLNLVVEALGAAGWFLGWILEKGPLASEFQDKGA